MFRCLEPSAEVDVLELYYLILGFYSSWINNVGRSCKNCHGLAWKGDLLVHVNVWTPKTLDKDGSKNLINLNHSYNHSQID